ncbi:MAG TPA: arylamine N-acetyltransferase [Actinospica sp.]|nr:arylamine N-acetyltransferase [Actinospica sp.]
MTVQDTREPHLLVDTPPDWDVEALDLDAYLARIGHTGSTAPTTEVLRALHRAHVAAIAFENVDVALGREIPLDPPALQRKLVSAGRGGYCFEHNLLFAAVLERLGFRVERHLARVRRGGTAVRYRAHAFLRVTTESGPWLVDVGFGDEGLLEPIAFTPDARLESGGWVWRLRNEGEQWVLQSLHRDTGWFDLYAWRFETHFRPDFEVSNHFTATHPRSTFVGRLIAMRGGPGLRHTLVDRELVTRHADGTVERAELGDATLLRTLREVFGIRLTARDADLLLDRLPISNHS